jgi:phytol kinase
MNRQESLDFAAATVLYFAASWTVAYLCGWLVDRHGMRVNYSRKIGHFITIGMPFGLQQAFGLDRNTTAVALAAFVAPMNLALYVRPVRERSATVARMFRGFDRPEDRPHTLSWLATQYIGVFAVYLALYPVLLARGVSEWMLIAIVVNVIGDGLAEPVGVTFGRHKYCCPALFSDRCYERSWEGSACVFLSAVLAILFCRLTFTETQFLAALLVVPVSSVLAEAASPHTWDAPILFLVVGGELALLSLL